MPSFFDLLDNDFVKFPANEFQPDCCKSLVVSWLRAMMSSEADGIEWCKKASQEKEASDFYAGNIARNGVLEGTERLRSIKVAELVSDYLVGKAEDARNELSSLSSVQDFKLKRELTADAKDSILAAKSVRDSFSGPLDDLKNGVHQQRAQKYLNVIEKSTWTSGLEVKLNEILASRAGHARYYMISLKAKSGSHAVGLATSMVTSFYVDIGHIYYYDPNLKCMLRFTSTRKAAEFCGSIKTDYQGLKKIQELVKK